MKRILMMILILVMMVSAGVFASETSEEIPREIRVVMDDNYPPYVFRNEEGDLVGIAIDQWRVFEEETGIRVRIDAYDWAEAQERMLSGEYDVIDTIFWNEEREGIYTFTRPYATISASLYFNSQISGITDMASAHGFNVATKTGDYSVEMLEEAGVTSIRFYDSYEAIVMAAVEGEETMFLMDDPPARYFLYREGAQEAFNSTEPLYSNQFYRAVLHENKALVSIIDAGFERVSESEYQAIEEKWFGRSAAISTAFGRTLAFVILMVSILWGLLIAWSIFLRKQVARRTEQLRSSLEENRDLTHRLKAMIAALPDVVLILDREGRIIDVPVEETRLRRYTKEELLGKLIMDIFPPDSLSNLDESFVRHLTSGVVPAIEIGIPVQNGLDYYELRMTAIDTESILVITRDVTQRRQYQERIEEMGIRDALTGCHNRNYFEEHVAIWHDLPKGFGIMICDVDALKQVNDTLGHQVGDRYLKDVASVIQRHSGQAELVARIGGDEFAMVFLGTSSRKMEEIKIAIKTTLGEMKRDYRFLETNLSIGYAVLGEKAEHFADLMKRADKDMYQEKIQHKMSRKSGNVKFLIHMLEARNFETSAHAKRLGAHSVMVAKSMGMPERFVNRVALLGEFHDVGKIGISDQILLKAGPLDELERAEMKRHTTIGYRIALSLPELEHIADLIHHHHEWYDGTGYPMGLKAEEIPLECRILSVVDAYDVMTNDRPYRKAMSKEKAVEELRRFSGNQFDPDIVALFIRLIGAEK